MLAHISYVCMIQFGRSGGNKMNSCKTVQYKYTGIDLININRVYFHDGATKKTIADLFVSSIDGLSKACSSPPDFI
jgi:hypothetical protein